MLRQKKALCVLRLIFFSRNEKSHFVLMLLQHHLMILFQVSVWFPKIMKHIKN